MERYHTSVFLTEVIQYLQVKPGQQYIDATLGGGGHTSAILENGGSVLGVDVDDEALAYVKERLRDKDIKILREKGGVSNISISQYPHIFLARGNFRNIDTIAAENGFENVSGIVFDLGVSSHQLDTVERGFSFQKNGPLDMRMDETLSVQAKDLVNALGKKELKELFVRFGEEGFAGPIASAIIAKRKEKPFTTTQELAELIRSIVRGGGPTDPATKVFQALRIAVNDELDSLQEALPKAVSLLKNQGRLVVISFHSLEDRIVKQAFRAFEAEGLGRVLTGKPIIPLDDEQQQNKRSRSAKLRVFEKS